MTKYTIKLWKQHYNCSIEKGIIFWKVEKMVIVEPTLFFPSMSLHKHDFCILLTATIQPGPSVHIERSNPSVREEDYMQSLKLWLSKTNLPVVFCENSGYWLRKIHHLCKQYPWRVEILQFSMKNYESWHDYGYGEYKIIDYALRHSRFLKRSRNIVKVTGRVFIENITVILAAIKNDSIVTYTKHFRKDGIQNIHTIIFIFKKRFLKYLENNVDILKKKKFEDFFYSALIDAKKNKEHIQKLRIHPLYQGYSWYTNTPYKNIFISHNKIVSFIYFFLLRIYKKIFK